MNLRLLIAILAVISVFPAYADSRAIKYPDSIAELKNGNFFKVNVALVTGVYDYTGGWPDLPGVESDLDTVSALLTKQGFKVEKAYNLSKEEYLARFDKFLSDYSMDPDARLLVYYAGHGHTLTKDGEKSGYIVLKDAADPAQDKDGFIRGSIPMSFFAGKAKEINAPQVLFMFDSCFSGSVFSMMRSIPELVLELLKKPVRQFISSGTESQMVPDDSVFRRRFVYGLSGEADLNRDDIITGSELGEYLRRSVTEYTAGTQTPVYGKLAGFEGEFVFVRSTNTPPASKPAAAKEYSDEKEKLLAIIKENPHSPDASKALERLREIDDSLKNEPPVTAPERKDFVMTAKSQKYIAFDSDPYPFMVIAPLDVPSLNGTYKAAFRIKAKDGISYKKLRERKQMIKAVMSRRLMESNLQLVSDIFEIRDRIKKAAYAGAEWVCPGCLAGEPAIAGLAGL